MFYRKPTQKIIQADFLIARLLISPKKVRIKFKEKSFTFLQLRNALTSRSPLIKSQKKNFYLQRRKK